MQNPVKPHRTATKRATQNRVAQNWGDRIFRSATAACALIAITSLALMAFEMVQASRPSLSHFGWGFLIGKSWDPVGEIFGALPFIFGTLASSLLALIIAVPIALGAAIFLSELAPQSVARPLGFLVEMLAAVPSVVYGLWGIFVLAPWLRESVEPALAKVFGFMPFFAGPALGTDLLAGGLILAIMILPTISSVSREVLRAVPLTLREAALALGATRWETVRVAVLPPARSGVVGATVLGLGRALGETMAVTMVIGNRPQIPHSLFSPAYTLASVIANEFSEATSDLHLAALAEMGLILFGVSVVLNVIARLLVYSVRSRA
jgi:phosphate transport system permease protein